jgi:hypothetical protein
MGRTALGVDLQSLSSGGSSFSTLYRKVFDESPIGQAISVLNMFIPVRSWLPVKENKEFIKSNDNIRQLLRQRINEKKMELNGDTMVKGEGSDLLTLMLKEYQWEDEDILGHVSTPINHMEGQFDGLIVVAVKFHGRRYFLLRSSD